MHLLPSAEFDKHLKQCRVSMSSIGSMSATDEPKEMSLYTVHNCNRTPAKEVSSACKA